MAKRKKKRGGRRRRKFPIAATAGVAAALLPIAQAIMGGDIQGAVSRLTSSFTGFDPATGAFNPQALQAGLLPILLGAGVSMLAAKAGINRYIQVPFVKI